MSEMIFDPGLLANLPPLSKEAQQYLAKIRKDPEFFCNNHIWIRDKDNNLVRFYWNSAQRLLFNAIWAMWIELGYVRLLGVKGRQQGFSTLVQALFFWFAVVFSKRVSIIAHKAESTAVLFEKFEVMFENLDGILKPKAQNANAKQMKWDNGAVITCVTAGSKESGRGDTAQLQHRSEVAFFDNPSDVKAGAGRIVSKLIGTMIIQESTGNGMNDYYEDVMKATKKKGRYRYVFVPWYIQSEYRSEVPEDFVRDEYEEKLVRLYNLDDEQLQWRRETIEELDAKGYPGEIKFKQEYPCTLQEAFQSTGNGFFDLDRLQEARKSDVKPEGWEPRIWGVDPGRVRDRTVIAKRQGRAFGDHEIHPKMDSMTLARILIKAIDANEVDHIFIDVGMGWGTIDRMRELRYGKYITPVDFGSGASEKRFGNKRAEMMFSLFDWFKEDVSVPDCDDMAADIGAIPMFKESSTGVITFPSKDDIRKTLKRSTDILDAMILTFAFPIKSDRNSHTPDAIARQRSQPKKESGLTARRRVQSLRRAS